MKCPAPSISKSRGFTLTEIAIILGIGGLILGAIWVGYSTVSSNQKVNKAVEDVDIILQNVRTYYASKNAFPSEVMTSYLITAGLLPADMINGGITVNPWGTTNVDADVLHSGVSIESQQGWGDCGAPCEAPNAFGIVFWGLPQQACIGLLGRFIGPVQGASVVGMYTDWIGAIASPSTATASQLPSFCTTGGASTANVVIYFQK